MNRFVKALSILALGSLTSFGFGQAVQPPTVKPLSMRARLVRVEGENRFIVRTQENKEITFFTAPGTRYVVNGKVVRLSELKPGADLTATYTLQNNQQTATVVSVGDADPDNVFRGLVTAKTAETITVKSQTGKEMAFNTNEKSRYTQRDKAVTVNEIKVGAVVEVRFVTRDNHAWVEELIINDVSAETNNEPGEEVKGVVVRYVGQNQVVIKTADNKEVTVDLNPQTTYLLNNQPARVADFPAGAEIRVQYNVRDRRPVARSIFGLRRVDR